jgi:hypothetical protein
MREHFVLVGKFPTAFEHGLLVQRREGDAVYLAGFGEVDRSRQSIAGQFAGARIGDAGLEGRRIRIAEIDDGNAVGIPIDRAR